MTQALRRPSPSRPLPSSGRPAAGLPAALLALTTVLVLACGAGKGDAAHDGEGGVLGGPKAGTTPIARPAGAATPEPEVLQQLRRQVEAGRLDEAVFVGMRDKGEADAIVVFDEERVMETVRRIAALRGVTLTDARIVELKAEVYAQLKQQLAAVAPSLVAVVEEYENLGVVRVRFVDASLLALVLSRPEVAGVRAIQNYRRTLKESLPLINQPQAFAAGFTGAGTAVAVLDSGVDYVREAFGSCTAPAKPKESCKVVFAADTVASDGMRDDEVLHGTNVAGIVLGVAPRTTIIAIDVFQGDEASDAGVLTGLSFVMRSKQRFNIVAVNMSLGDADAHFTTPCRRSVYTSVFRDLRQAGILPVVSAGNEAVRRGTFVNGVGNPACAPGAISVGAVYDGDNGSIRTSSCSDSRTRADQITCFSQSGPTLTILAPGARITAAGVTQGGTSQAAPHVAGAVAALASRCPAATVDQIERALTTTGPAITDPRNDVTVRRLDVAAAGAALVAEGVCKT